MWWDNMLNGLHRIPPPPPCLMAKGGGWKNVALGARFQKLEGGGWGGSG